MHVFMRHARLCLELYKGFHRNCVLFIVSYEQTSSWNRAKVKALISVLFCPLMQICDWICQNCPFWHNNGNSFYGLTLKLHSLTVQAHQGHGYR